MLKSIKNVKVLEVGLATGKLIVWCKKYESDRVVDVLLTFFVAVEAKIQDISGNALTLSQVKVKNRITIDYTRDDDNRLVASNVVVVVGPYERGCLRNI